MAISSPTIPPMDATLAIRNSATVVMALLLVLATIPPMTLGLASEPTDEYQAPEANPTLSDTHGACCLLPPCKSRVGRNSSWSVELRIPR